MYDLRQFKPTLYLVLILGLTAFCMAVDSLGLWGMSVLVIGLNAWLVKTGRFRPFPRWLANLVVLAAVGYILMRVLAQSEPPLNYVGQFLVLLHLIKLYEARGNRDFAQLLVLSLLLMVAAAINSTSLGFGLLMFVYLVLSVYCCLLFHLKVEADHAREALAIPGDKLSPSTLRQDERFLPRSMRRLTALVWSVSVAMAVLVFMFFPRGAGAGLLGQFQLKSNTSLTGISDRMMLDQINRIQQNTEKVAHVYVWKDEKEVQDAAPLYLRMLALDTYRTDDHRPQWYRSTELKRSGGEVIGEAPPPDLPRLPLGAPVWRQRIRLEPTGTRYLFALPGLMYYELEPRRRQVDLRLTRPLSVRDGPADDSLQTEMPISNTLEYEVYCTNAPHAQFPVQYTGARENIPRSDPKVLKDVRAYAMPLLPPEIRRKFDADPDYEPSLEEREAIARILEQHLRTQFSYTLDLTPERRRMAGKDPVVAFLTTVKRGHCVYFASAMTLMCQSLRVPARTVNGFRCDEYNPFGGHYIVRQSHAHAWVEVLLPRGWTTFDPTSSREASVQDSGGLWQSIRHFFDFLECKWAETIVSYDARGRERLIQKLDAAVLNAVNRTAEFFKRLGDMTASTAFWEASLSFINLLIWTMVLGAFGFLIWFAVSQYRIRRRAVRIGIESLPVPQRIRLVRQLAFYDMLMQLLHRGNIHRPRHATHMEFADLLVFLPAGIFRSIRRLTGIFYRVR